MRSKWSGPGSRGIPVAVPYEEPTTELGKRTAAWPRREADMSPIVSAWLRGRGCKVYAEVQFYDRFIDHVGIDVDGMATAVEMKRRYGWRLLYQAAIAQVPCDETWAASANRPKLKHIEQCAKQGVGVLLVSPEGVIVLLEADHQNPHLNRLSKASMVEYLADAPEGGIGGLTSKAQRATTELDNVEETNE